MTSKEYYVAHRQERLDGMRKYREKNRKKLCDKQKAYYAKNHIARLAYMVAYRAEHPEACAERSQRLGAIWRAKPANKRKMRKRRRIYEQRRRDTDPWWRALKSLRARLSAELRKVNTKKTKRTRELLGMPGPEFLVYIAKQFEPGMSWDNYGEWHLDHIVPCATFDLTDTDQQGKCFHWTNLRPLWAIDNLTRPRPSRKRVSEVPNGE